ncbi:hypothetical protein [Helicobacter valdiviensis]|nr:hypothetical protein [Helicobacter valdiviensis]
MEAKEKIFASDFIKKYYCNYASSNLEKFASFYGKNIEEIGGGG